MKKKVQIRVRMVLDSDDPMRDAHRVAEQIAHNIKFEDTIAYDIKVKDVSAGVDLARFANE